MYSTGKLLKQGQRNKSEEQSWVKISKQLKTDQAGAYVDEEDQNEVSIVLITIYYAI